VTAIVEPDVYQKRIRDWVHSTFGEDAVTNVRERALRLLEEAIELAQACGIRDQTALQLVAYVFSRSPGKPAQELAGCLLTAYAAASALGVNAREELEKELERVHTPEVIERCRKRQAEKRARFR
jgi:NTP pyrophosphatase (non-canonical NTP hydrolase)